MTPEQAANIIVRDHGALTINSIADLCAALNSIGLLAFAVDPQAGLQPGPQAGAGQLNQPVPVDWATLRDRKAREQSLADQFPNETLATIHHRAKGE